MPSSKAALHAQLTDRKLAQSGIDPERLGRIYKRIDKNIEEGLYPGAAIALARGGHVVASANFGLARLGSEKDSPQPATDETLWLLYSQTKPISSCAIWILIERGLLNVHESVAYYIPEFGRHNKDEVTVLHALTHQAGLPNARVPEPVWEDHNALKEAVCDWKLEWQPGSKVFYHASAAHWIQALLIEAISGVDFRQFIKEEILQPLGLQNLYLGVPDSLHERLVLSYERNSEGEHLISPEFNSPEWFRCGAPSGGAYATASDVALFYQMLLSLGQLNGVRVLSPRMVQWAVRNHTADRIDEFFGLPMHRGLGVHVRGTTAQIRGLSSIASATTFGHGGVGTSYTWADPETRVSFTYLTNSRLGEPAHSRRMEEIMTMAQACVVDL